VARKLVSVIGKADPTDGSGPNTCSCGPTSWRVGDFWGSLWRSFDVFHRWCEYLDYGNP